MLGDNIKNYRKLNGMSQDDLAEKLDVTRQSVSLWETGQSQPSLDNIIALSKLFGVSTDVLLSIENAPVPATESAPAAEDKAKAAPAKSSKGKLTALIIAGVLVLAALAVLPLALQLKKPGTEPVVTNEEDPASSGTEDVPSASSGTAQDPTPASKEAFNKDELYDYLKAFAVEHGRIEGDYCVYSIPSEDLGVSGYNLFSLWYWGDTDTVEFSLHRTIDDAHSINYYLRVPKAYTGDYEYIASCYTREDGAPIYEAKGTIPAEKFTKNYPLTSTSYYGPEDRQTEFMETSRLGLCDLLFCLEKFCRAENLECTFEDMGFVSFN